ncbi:hypothetical protein CLV42_103276 [Chitinophaga ginsengisoli]|uniref:Uncharacterized protein n=1 Tax=Chitinophaga ginsengisoli TaxID=363837 RepID=A0A2P8GH45_9BACT|nr:hypothetical protein CLV42_103276 [Chitinophaga ginsengisoli]
MNVKCKNCLPKEGIEVPELSPSEKKKLLELTLQSPIYSVKYLVDIYGLSHLEAKYIVAHVNRTYGLCNRCNFDKLDKEYMVCPKCGSLNFNWEC